MIQYVYFSSCFGCLGRLRVNFRIYCSDEAAFFSHQKQSCPFMQAVPASDERLIRFSITWLI